MDFLLMVVSACVLSLAMQASADYSAAVVEYPALSWLLPFVNEEQAQMIINLNLDRFDAYTADAVSQGADIIVFPEYGATGFVLEKRDLILPFLETVPNPLDFDPKTYIPCFKAPTNITIQHRLSCMALKYNITIIANLMTVYYCNETDPNCPDDGRYQFNTDVTFGNQGELLARYHKENLYTGEAVMFNPGHNQTKVAAFKTSFGYFGLFTCFDMLFSNPADQLIKQLGVDTMVFPTAWMNELPLLSAAEYQQAWSLSYGVHLLAANFHNPIFEGTGSGIYSPDTGAIVYFYEMDSFHGKMLIAQVKNSETRKRISKIFESDSTKQNTMDNFKAENKDLISSDRSRIRQVLTAERMSVLKWSGDYSRAKKEDANNLGNAVSRVKNASRAKMNSEHFSEPEFSPASRDDKVNVPTYFTSNLNDDQYNMTLLEGTKGQANVSNGNITCLLEFQRDSDTELFALAGFDGMHTKNGYYYIQACSLVRCASDSDPYRCGEEMSQGTTIYQRFNLMIKGQSGSTRLFPEVVTSGVRLPKPRVEWDFTPGMDRIWSEGNAVKDPLIAANIFGRLFDMDPSR